MVWLPQITVPSPGETVGSLLHASIAASIARTFEHLPHIGEEDPERLHQARVGLRRLRSDLKTFRPFFTEHASTLRRQVRPLARALGSVRDIDVLRADLGALDLLPQAERQVVVATVNVLDRRRRQAAEALVEVVEGAADLLDELAVFAAAPPVRLGAMNEPGKRLLRPVRKLWRKLQERPLLPEAADEDLHHMRIEVKRFRYGMEAVAPLVGKKARRTARRAAEVQQLLGEHQDAVVERRWLLAVARHLEAPTSTVFVELAGAELTRRRDLRRSLPETWQRLQRAATWL